MSVSALSTSPALALIALEQEWSARSLESVLGPGGYAVLRAHSGQQALELASTARPDIVIIDARLPDMTGLEVCRKLQEDAFWNPHTPVVITTSGSGEREQRLAAFREGAWEFVAQPLDGEALLLKLGTYMRSKREFDRMRSECLLDPTTGLYTIQGLARRAHEIGAAAFRRHDALACVAFSPMVDDMPAERLSTKLMSSTTEQLGVFASSAGRASDVIGHLGHAEFAIIAPATTAAGALRLAERLRDAIGATLLRSGEQEYRLSIKAGYCAVPDFSHSSIDAVEILLRAAKALRHLRFEGTGEIKAFDELAIA